MTEFRSGLGAIEQSGDAITQAGHALHDDPCWMAGREAAEDAARVYREVMDARLTRAELAAVRAQRAGPRSLRRRERDADVVVETAIAREGGPSRFL